MAYICVLDSLFPYVCYFIRAEFTALAAELNPVDLGQVCHCCVYSNVYIGQTQYYICMNIMKAKRKEAWIYQMWTSYILDNFTF